jgi:hypothetical protein
MADADDEVDQFGVFDEPPNVDSPIDEPPNVDSPIDEPPPDDVVVPTVYYSLSCPVGLVGVFDSIEQVTAVLQLYPSIKFVAHKYNSSPGETQYVWVVLYRDVDAVAFVSNDREAAERVHKIYLDINLTYDDSIDYWRRTVNFISDGITEKMQEIEHPMTDEERMKKYIDHSAHIARLKQYAASSPSLDFEEDVQENFNILDHTEPIT